MKVTMLCIGGNMHGKSVEFEDTKSGLVKDTLDGNRYVYAPVDCLLVMVANGRIEEMNGDYLKRLFNL